MPYKFDTNHIKLPKEYDRRVKITPEDKQKVLELYKNGLPIREIKRRVSFSRRSIQFIIFPDRLALVKKQYKDREQHKTTYSKVKGEQWNKTQKEHRQYKQKTLKELKII